MSQTRKVGWVLLMGAALLFVAEIPNALLFIGEHPVQDVLNPLYVPSNAVSATTGPTSPQASSPWSGAW
jgi:hypothetical protein